jgi:hypothetical protein
MGDALDLIQSKHATPVGLCSLPLFRNEFGRIAWACALSSALFFHEFLS